MIQREVMVSMSQGEAEELVEILTKTIGISGWWSDCFTPRVQKAIEKAVSRQRCTCCEKQPALANSQGKQ